MGLLTRVGLYGTYIGNDFNSSQSLSYEQMKINATYIYNYLSAKGWSVNAIAGLLGNMQHESSINPGRWQSEDVGNVSMGYGLCQWTPSTKYTSWCTQNKFTDPSTMDANLGRLIYEVENMIQYYATDGYPESFSEFTKSMKSPYYLACAFAWNYERSYVVLYGSESEREALRQKRGGSANEWFEYLTGGEAPVIPTTKNKKKKFNFILFGRVRRSI